VTARWSFYQCPSAPKPLTGYGRHYGCNDVLFTETHGFFGPPYPQNDFGAIDDRPASIILAMDVGVSPTSGSSYPWAPQLATQPIIADFKADPTGAPGRANDPVITPAGNDNDSGTGLGYPIYSRHFGNCPAVMADGHVQLFKNGEIQRRNFAARARAWHWGSGSWVDINYP
jgi:hypothetical protein